MTFRWLDWLVHCWHLYSALLASYFPAFLSPITSRSPDESGPVYSIDPSDEREPTEAFGEDLDKELKQSAAKSDMAEPLTPYELNSYQSEFQFILSVCWVLIWS